MEVPSDGLLLEGVEITTDESAMTGETDPMKKAVLSKCLQEKADSLKDGGERTAHTVSSPMLLSGTTVLSGEGTMMILAVGDQSAVGKINALLRQDEPDETPLQQKLTRIAEDIGKFGLVSAIVIVLVMLVRFAIERLSADESDPWDNSIHYGEILNFFIIGITVVVVAIPEGLPLAVTLSLAYSVKKMLLDQNLVRKLQACETMGGADCICSDKTGTLTQNVMSLKCMWNTEMI